MTPTTKPKPFCCPACGYDWSYGWDNDWQARVMFNSKANPNTEYKYGWPPGGQVRAVSANQAKCGVAGTDCGCGQEFEIKGE